YSLSPPRAASDASCTRAAWPARQRDTACAASFLCYPFAGARRRPALNPGIAWSRVAFNDADLHRGRYGTLARGLREHTSARAIIIPHSHPPPLALTRALLSSWPRVKWRGSMSAHENLEHAEHAEHAAHSNKKIALLLAVLALFLAFSETLGQTSHTAANP